MTFILQLRRLVMLVALFGAAVHIAHAQPYPNRAVKIVVPYATGGTNDIIARVIASGLTAQMGQPFIVENRPGTGGSVGSAYAAKQPPDGYTLVMVVESSHAINPSVATRLPYDPIKDFAPISNVADVPNVLVVGKASTVNDVRELVARLKSEPGLRSYGSSGYGGLSNIYGELFTIATGTKALHVPYKGMGPALVDIVSGQIDYGVDNLPSPIGLIEGGQLKALAVASKERIKKLPNVPTFGELGIASMNKPSWVGLGAPAAVPPAILDALNLAVKKALDDPAVLRQLDQLGARPSYMPRVAFASFVKEQNEQWKKTVADAGIPKIE